MEFEKKSYFISLDKGTVENVSVGDTTEYEVIATSDEIETFKSYIGDNKSRDFWFAMKNLTFKPFDEMEVDEMRKQDDEGLMKAYRFIYNYGTEETKRKLKEIGFTQDHYNRK